MPFHRNFCVNKGKVVNPTNYRLPDFIAVGPQKAGTTWLYEFVKTHPGICTCTQTKETHFFDERYEKGLHWYISHFECDSSVKSLCEIAPSYFNNKSVPLRIKRTIPDCKIICTLRHPVDRTYSLYKHWFKYGRIKSPFREAVHKHTFLLESSCYSLYLCEWIKVFGKENILIMFFEDFVRDKQAYVTRFCDFVGIETILIPQELNKKIYAGGEAPRMHCMISLATLISRWLRDKRLYSIINFVNKSGLRKLFFKKGFNSYGSMPEDLRDELRKYFMPEIESLERLLQIKLPIWKK